MRSFCVYERAKGNAEKSGGIGPDSNDPRAGVPRYAIDTLNAPEVIEVSYALLFSYY